MTKRELERRVRTALETVNAAIAEPSGKYGRGMAAEGYAGGYRDALHDVIAALGGWEPSNSRYWPRPTERSGETPT